MLSHEEENGIFIPPNNRMTAKFVMYGVDHNDKETDITVRVLDNSGVITEITVKVDENEDKQTEIDIKYRGNNDLYTEIQPIGSNNIETEIEVPPHNRMAAIYEIMQPPKITEIFNPNQDSFTREKKDVQSINYGKNSTLAVGRVGDDIYRSYIQFGFEEWNPQYIITDVKLRLYYSGIIPEGSELELLTVNKQWYEMGITHLNRPTPIDFITTNYTKNSADRYVEFEMTDTVVKWLSGASENNGFIVRMSNETTETLISFRSRETNRPPELLVTYYDTKIYSASRTQVPMEIFVWNAEDSDIVTEITVSSVIGSDEKITEIYVHRKEVPVPNDLITEITVTREKVNTEIEVSLTDTSEIETTITVRSDVIDDKVDTYITVSKPLTPVEIFVKYADVIDTEVTVQRYEDNEIYTEIAVSRELVEVEIYVKYIDEVDTEITVQQNLEDNIPAEIIASRPQIDTEIAVRAIENKYKYTEITVQRSYEDEIYTELSVSREFIYTEITSSRRVVSGIETEIYARAYKEEEVDTSISVTRDFICTEITVTEFGDIDTEIYVKHTDDIEMEITVTVFDNVETEIDVVQASKIPTEITVTRRKIDTIITVPYWEDYDMPTNLEVRVLRASDITTEITIRSKGGAYAFII